MSRGVEGRRVAWQVWIYFHTAGDAEPVAYVHQCGSIGSLRKDDHPDYSDVICPGCRFEIAHPEVECQPLYGDPAVFE